MTAMVWFRNDLRLADNPALTIACNGTGAVEACFVLTPGQWHQHDWSPAKVDLLCKCLRSLAGGLARLGLVFHLIEADNFADSEGKLIRLAYARQITSLHVNEEYAFNEKQRDQRVQATFQKIGIEVHRYRDQTVVPVDGVLTKAGAPYTVFTPYSRSWKQWLGNHPIALYAVPKPRGPALVPTGVPNLCQSCPGSRHSPLPGEDGAWAQLDQFIRDEIGDYESRRDFPALSGTSRISPYLALGILSGRQCFMAAQEAEACGLNSEGVAAWITQICWRDFYISILHHFPHVGRHQAFRRAYDDLKWDEDEVALKAWQDGMTGIPLVDAAMRQLNQTGWMHNRLRMVAAMFLSKNLLLDWKLGERYFMHHLVDGYLPSNNGGWQWSASTGTDPVPYFRIFNPVTQAERFDPQGEFIRRYVPELRDLPGKAIFAPWEYGKRPKEYPAPIIDLKRSRSEAIARFKAFRAKE